MGIYVFGKKHAKGGGLVMVGNDIHEAVIELEKRSTHRATGGGPITKAQLPDFDTQWLTEAELRDCGG